MRAKATGLCILVVAVGTLGFVRPVDAAMRRATIPGAIVDEKPINALAVFDIVDGKLQIDLKNIATRSDYTVAHTVSDVSFNMPGVEFQVTGSSVVVGPGSSWMYDGTEMGGEGTDVSSEWALATNTVLPAADGSSEDLGPFDYSITATAFNGSEVKFADGTLSGNPDTVDGPNFGLINPQVDIASPPFNNGNGVMDMVVDSVLITLAAKTTLVPTDLSRITNVAFSYGSAHSGVGSVPEPASVVVWSLLGILGIAFLRLRRRKAA